MLSEYLLFAKGFGKAKSKIWLITKKVMRSEVRGDIFVTFYVIILHLTLFKAIFCLSMYENASNYKVVKKT